MTRKRKIGSIKNELATKARESMLSAVQIYNNPNVLFKSETFVVLSIIAWTYLLHAYYRSKKIDYSYYISKNGRKKYDKTKYGAIKHWELERCLNDDHCPIDAVVKENIRFIIGLRHEIEHQMTTRIDDALSARFQACCINFYESIMSLLGSKYSIRKHLSFSLHFTSLSEKHIDQLREYTNLPKNVSSFVASFDGNLSNEEYNDSKYSYRVLFIQKTVNRKGQADKVIEFLPKDSPLAEGLNKEYIFIKDREKPKFLPKAIVELMKNKGYTCFSMYHFTQCWKQLNAKQDNTYGILVAGKTWYWYENFIPIVEKYCETNNLH